MSSPDYKRLSDSDEEVPNKGAPQIEGKAATLEEDDPGDQAYLILSKSAWFKVWLVLSICLAVAEPILIPHPQAIIIQKVILALSTVLFLIGYIAVMINMPEGSFFFRLTHACLAETYIEIVCLILGWVLLYIDPSMAPLRCFRVLRFVWYSEIYPADPSEYFYPLTFFCHTVLQYLEKIGQELFTTSSKGGVIILGFFFFSVYIMGISFFNATQALPLVSAEGGPNGTLSECDTLTHCFLIMLRLSFFDGSGFDYVKSIMDYGSSSWAFLLILYMCFSALVLLNGLIGIFGSTFDEATKEDEAEEAAAKEHREKDTIQEIRKVVNRVEGLLVKLQEEINILKHQNN